MTALEMTELLSCIVRDALRYRWLRSRMELRCLEAMSGVRREAFSMRIGCDYIDSDHDPRAGYLNPENYDIEQHRFDAAVDKAMAGGE